MKAQLVSITASLAIAGCATSPTLTAPNNVPAKLNPPAGQVLYLEVPATGVQIYECQPKRGAMGSEWVFRSPEAVLWDTNKMVIGKHYGGPTWEGNDGSKVVGAVKERDPGPDASAIPWLLLEAKSNLGAGIFEAAKSIQRVATTGGVAPAKACEASTKEIARVPYTATYYFYRAGTGY